MQARTFLPASLGTAADSRPAAVPRAKSRIRFLRHRADAWLAGATILYALFVVAFPTALTVGVGAWWMLNTVAHNFIHRPFFESRVANKVFAAWLSMLTLVPQQLWRERHLAHHRERKWRPRFSEELCIQFALIASVWACISTLRPELAAYAMLPGFLLAMTLCALQGHFEHARGTTSHYGAIYNWLLFNDGFHLEHHERPGAHWTVLPQLKRDERASKWPPVLRWCEWFELNGLERGAARIPFLRRWLVAVHERAVRELTRELPAPERVGIVGGGLFPRTALVVHNIWPDVKVTIVDSEAAHLTTCRRWLRGDEELVHARVIADALPRADLVFVPLAFEGDRRRCYEARHCSVVIHDWIWNRPSRARTAVASYLLLKRINLVE